MASEGKEGMVERVRKRWIKAARKEKKEWTSGGGEREREGVSELWGARGKERGMGSRGRYGGREGGRLGDMESGRRQKEEGEKKRRGKVLWRG